MGQFAFVETYCGFPLIDAMSELLLQGQVNFAWEERTAQVRLPEIRETALARMEDLGSKHLKRPKPAAASETSHESNASPT